MVSSPEFNRVLQRLVEVESRLNTVEANSRNAASAAISRGESGRWPDRETITKMKSWLHESVRIKPPAEWTSEKAEGARELYKTLLKNLEDLDKGEAVTASQDATE
jgi:hypothetical protein